MLGGDHPKHSTAMSNLASAYQAAGQLDKALPLYQQTLAKRMAALATITPTRSAA